MSVNSRGIASRLASQSGLVMLGNIFTFVVGFPFQIYLARKLGAHQLGALGLFEVVALTIGPLFSFGLGFSLLRFVPQYIGQSQNHHVRRLVATVFASTMGTGFVAATMVIVSSPILLHLMPELHSYADLFPLAALMAFLGMMISISQQSLRAFFDMRNMIVMSSFLQLLIKVVITIALLGMGWALRGYMVAVVVSSTTALISMLWVIRFHVRRLKHTTEVVSSATKKSWLSYSQVMYGTYLLSVAGPFFERFLLASMIDLASVGVLLAIRQLQMFLQVPLTIISTGVAPMFVAAKAGDDEAVKHTYYIATDWVCRLGLPLLFFMLFFGGEILAIYGSAFAMAGQFPLMLLVIAQILNLLTGPVGTMLEMIGHERKIFYFNVISNVIGFGCMLALVPFLGLVGIAVGAALSTLCFNVMTLLAMKKQLGINWWSARYARLVIPLGVVLFALALIKLTYTVAGAWMLAALLLLSYGIFFGVYACAGLSSEDREIVALLRGKIMPSTARDGSR